MFVVQGEGWGAEVELPEEAVTRALYFAGARAWFAAGQVSPAWLRARPRSTPLPLEQRCEGAEAFDLTSADKAPGVGRNGAVAVVCFRGVESISVRADVLVCFGHSRPVAYHKSGEAFFGENVELDGAWFLVLFAVVLSTTPAGACRDGNRAVQPRVSGAAGAAPAACGSCRDRASRSALRSSQVVGLPARQRRGVLASGGASLRWRAGLSLIHI